MRLPKNILSNTFRKPDVYLCEVDKTKICKLDTSNMQASLKFNSYSELSFEVGRTYNDILTGATEINPYYDLIEALRLIYVEGFGYFEIQGPELVGDGIKEAKSITTYSYEYTLSQKYLEDFYVNTGETNSKEVINASSENNIVPVTLYNPNNKKLSLLHLVLEKDYAGWKIGHVDPQLQTLSRQFEVDRESIYDFLMNEVCEKFNCYIVFDTIETEINVYAESPTEKFIGDGKTNIFVCKTPFSSINTVSINGYKTTKWSYDGAKLTLEDTPESGAMIEIVGEDSTWETDVFVTFDNLSQEIKVNYDADSIKTVLTVTFGDDNDIREVNLGLPYIVDLSYYCTPEWMGQDLYDDWLAYQEECNSKQSEYTNNSREMVEISDCIWFEEGRQSLQYATADNVASDTVGTYYVRGGVEPNYYYTEVLLPAEYNINTTYYKLDGINLTEESATDLYYAIEEGYLGNGVAEIRALSTTDYTPFAFMDDAYSIGSLADNLEKADTMAKKDTEVNKFLDIMWEQVGRKPLKEQYLVWFKKTQITLIDGGHSQKDDPSYPSYYLITIFIDSIERAIKKRDANINNYENQYNTLAKHNADIANELLMENNFTKGQLMRLNAFLREDELHLDDIVTTSQDSIADTYKNQQDALESGKIELKKISQPQLQFSMSMANIYALPEFEPIIDQFQLGRMIKVAIRPGYIKQSRLMQVNINFEDFSDFSCEFSELTSPRSQSDIHADLLKNAISAGKSVAQNASYWTKGSDQATKTDLKIQQGLLDAIEAIKSTDATQNAYLDKYGLHLEKIDPVTGEDHPEKVWLVNNKIVFTDDNFKTSRMALGKVTVDGQEYYGIISEIMLAGYIEGSKMVGGTINIGDGAFVVHEDGSVTMNGGSTIAGYTTEEYVRTIQTNLQGQIDGINNTKMYRVEICTSDSLIIKDPNQTATLTCKIYSWDTDVTNNYKDYIRWVRVSNDTASDEVWNAQSNHKGVKSITIDSSDIAINASFHCEVDMPE